VFDWSLSTPTNLKAADFQLLLLQKLARDQTQLLAGLYH